MKLYERGQDFWRVFFVLLRGEDRMSCISGGVGKAVKTVLVSKREQIYTKQRGLAYVVAEIRRRCYLTALLSQ